MIDLEELKLMSPHLKEKYLEIYRAIPPGEKLRAACDLADIDNRLLRAGIRQLHPDWPERRLQIELFSLRLSPEQLEKIFGDELKQYPE